MFEAFKNAVSSQRLEGYRLNGCRDAEVFGRYLLNVALCESFYPSLQHLEVGLRNALYKAGNVAFRDTMWFTRSFMDNRSIEDIVDAQNKLQRESKDHLDPNRIVAELKFGFWTRLFGRHYEGYLWRDRAFFATAIPYASRRERQRTNLATRFDRIRYFRNRIFHHEPILDYDLARHHDDIIEAMNWIDPALVKANSIVDRFSEISGREFYTDLMTKVSDELNRAS